MYARTYNLIKGGRKTSINVLLPLIIEFCGVVGTDGNRFGHNGHRKMHQATIAIVEEIFQPHAIGVPDRDCFETLTILLCLDNETEVTRFHLSLAEHPTVEEKVFIAA